MADIFLYGILTIAVLNFLLERWLSWLNSRKRNTPLPHEVADVYEPERYSKQQAYKQENDRLGMISSTLSVIIIITLMLTGGFGWADTLAAQVSEQPIWRALIFFGILGLAADLIGTPFAWYDTFVIEERYGFNKTTPRTFWLDKLKGWLLAILLGGGLMALVLWIYYATAGYFWLLAWAALTLLSVFLTLFYSNLIVPLFNKQTPLEAGPLRDKLEAFSRGQGFELHDIYVIDGSKRSTKANAYFSGLGPKKRIVLYDTLIKDMDADEITAVLAHEIGHYKKKHVQWGMLESTAQAGIMFYVLSLFIGNADLSQALGSTSMQPHLNLIGFALLFTPVSMLTGLLANALSRHNEYQADRFAARHLGSAPLISGLKKLSSLNLSNLTPHPWYVTFHYSHPTLLQRIRAMKGTKKNT